jgi:CubicO group peptidase (beta-lactamase class C family)
MNQTQTFAQLDSVLETIQSRWGLPGLAVGIVQNGAVAYTKCLGVQRLESDQPVTPDSLFCLASIAKCFVACAVLQLVETGRLDLDAPVTRYLPEFQLQREYWEQITARQMLSHTAGIPDMDEAEYDELVAHPEVDARAPARLVRALPFRKMIARPGERFAYSNLAYDALGLLITRATGQTFEEYMKENILALAGMPDSTFYFPEVPLARLAAPHLRLPQMTLNPILPYHRSDAPSSFLYASLTEMCHWAITSLNRGRFDGQQILSPASYDLMWTPVVPRGYPPFRLEMGLGWALGRFEGLRTVAHGGGGFGWTCHLILVPEENIGAIILSNEESTAIEALEQAVMRTALGLAPSAGPVSWMIPIAQALVAGGPQAAQARYENIINDPQYSVDPYDLIPLVYQLRSAHKWALARQVLQLNLRVFPEDSHSKSLLAQLPGSGAE